MCMQLHSQYNMLHGKKWTPDCLHPILCKANKLQAGTCIVCLAKIIKLQASVVCLAKINLTRYYSNNSGLMISWGDVEIYSEWTNLANLFQKYKSWMCM